MLLSTDIPAIKKLEDETAMEFWGEANYRRFLEQSPEYYGWKVIVEADRRGAQLAGFLLARAVHQDLDVLKLAVKPRFHRRGMGSLLLRAMINEGLGRGCGRCFLEVRKSNRGAIAFYLRHAFELTGTRCNYYTNPIEDAWVMRRALVDPGTPRS